MSDRIDPDLFNIASSIGKQLKSYDQNMIERSSQGDAFKLDISKLVRSGGSNPPQIDPTVNMPDPAGNFGYDELPPIPAPVQPPSTLHTPTPTLPSKSNDGQMELGFDQVTLNQIFDKIDSLEVLLNKIYKEIKK